MKTNESVKKLENYSLDQLVIRRDALLKKKRLLDAIEKLRQDAPKNQTKFVTSCSFIVKVTGIQQLPRLKDFLKSIEANNAVSIPIEDTLSGINWGSYKIIINIGDQFDNYYENISQEFHKLDERLGRTKENKWIKYTSLAWITAKILGFLRTFKISVPIFAVLGLLVYDYSTAWKTLNFIKDFILGLFK